MRAKLANYSEIEAAALKENLAYFLKEDAPAAECGIKLAPHPDNPPCDIFGLLRIVSTQKDLLNIVSFAE